MKKKVVITTCNFDKPSFDDSLFSVSKLWSPIHTNGIIYNAPEHTNSRHPLIVFRRLSPIDPSCRTIRYPVMFCSTQGPSTVSLIIQDEIRGLDGLIRRQRTCSLAMSLSNVNEIWSVSSGYRWTCYVHRKLRGIGWCTLRILIMGRMEYDGFDHWNRRRCLD